MMVGTKEFVTNRKQGVGINWLFAECNGIGSNHRVELGVKGLVAEFEVTQRLVGN